MQFSKDRGGSIETGDRNYWKITFVQFAQIEKCTAHPYHMITTVYDVAWFVTKDKSGEGVLLSIVNYMQR